jgi:hypothetical protein
MITMLPQLWIIKHEETTENGPIRCIMSLTHLATNTCRRTLKTLETLETLELVEFLLLYS